MYGHAESRTRHSRQPDDGLSSHYSTTVAKRSRASSIPATARTNFGLGLSSFSRVDEVEFDQHVASQTSLAGQEASWPLMASENSLLPSTEGDGHYNALETPFHPQILGSTDISATVPMFQQSTPSPAPVPLLQPYAQYQPGTSQNFAGNIQLPPSHNMDALGLEIAPPVKAEDEYNEWLLDQSDSGSSFSGPHSEVYETPPRIQLSPQRSWQTNPHISQSENIAHFEPRPSKLPIRASKRPSVGGHPPCQCSFCGQLFGKRSNLKTHEQYKHSPNYVKRFECSTAGCGRKFDRKMDLKRHIKSVSRTLASLRCVANNP